MREVVTGSDYKYGFVSVIMEQLALLGNAYNLGKQAFDALKHVPDITDSGVSTSATWLKVSSHFISEAGYISNV